MGQTSVTTSASRINGIFDVSKLAQSSILEGAVVAYQTSLTDDNDVVLPTGANAVGCFGVSMGAGSIPGGTATSGSDMVACQMLGRAKVLLAASTTVKKGQQAVVANSTGHVTNRTQWTTSAQVIGYFAQDHTSGSTAEFVMVDLFIHNVETAMPIAGFDTGAPGAATKYLSGPGSSTGAASQVPLFVCPNSGTLRTFNATASTAPGGSDTGVFTVWKLTLSGASYGSWATTALTCTISSAAVQASDTTHTVAVAAGDLIAIGCVSSATTLSGLSASVLFT